MDTGLHSLLLAWHVSQVEWPGCIESKYEDNLALLF